MDDCIFCRIVKGEIPSAKVYEDKNHLAFLDIAPANKGHTLIITKKHYETFTDVPDKEMREFIAATQKIANAVSKGLNAEGLNVFMNNKRTAGQIVPHVHFHIVPRYEGDGIKFDWPKREYAGNEKQETIKKIVSFL